VLTIAWDVDDVLNDLMYCWFKQQWLPEHSDCKIKYNDIIENPPHDILGISLEGYLMSLDAFRCSALFQKMTPVAEIYDLFAKYGRETRNVALTAVPLCGASNSAAWVFRHYGEWIRTFHFVPSKRRNENIAKFDLTKKDFLSWIEKVDIIVDDNEKNIALAGEVGVKGVLIPRPWDNSELSLENTLDSLTDIINKDRSNK